MDKVFRKIPSLDFRYEVSRDGVVRNVKSKKIKKQKVENGYYRTSYRVNKSNPHYSKSQGWDRPVHQLVMECWGQAKPNGTYIIDHIDRNRLNNDISNLRWVTYKENSGNISPSELQRRKDTSFEKFEPFVVAKRKPVTLVKDGCELHFDSRFQAAKYLNETLFNGEKTIGGMRSMCTRMIRRKHIYGYNVI